jgi:hypothetical protein
MKRIGIYNPYIETKGGGEKICLALADTLSRSPNTEVYLITHKEVSLKHLGHYFQIDTSRLKLFTLNFDTKFTRFISRLPLPGGVRNLFYDAKTLSNLKKAGFDVFINNCYQSNLPNPSPYGVYMCMFPQLVNDRHEPNKLSATKRIYKKVLRIMGRLILNPMDRHAVYTYDLITANSAYTQGYIKKYWGLNSKILYPFGEDMLDIKTSKKDKIILHVGRFFENIGECHNKRQDFMINAFSKMRSLHKEGWELHLVGSVAEDVGALRHILSLMNESNGLPIFFHFNSTFPDMKKLYNRAWIYWHATGYGADPKKHPEKQEHFGITTVEAMSARAIPVVINSAGQKEVVQDKVGGYLWRTEKELIDKTTMVARMSPGDLKIRQAKSRENFRSYNKEAFERTVNQIFSEIS